MSAEQVKNLFHLFCRDTGKYLDVEIPGLDDIKKLTEVDCPSELLDTLWRVSYDSLDQSQKDRWTLKCSHARDLFNVGHVDDTIELVTSVCYQMDIHFITHMKCVTDGYMVLELERWRVEPRLNESPTDTMQEHKQDKMTEKETTIAIALTELNNTLFTVRRIQSIIEETFKKAGGHMTTTDYHCLLYGPEGITERLDRIANDLEMVSDLPEVVELVNRYKQETLALVTPAGIMSAAEARSRIKPQYKGIPLDIMNQLNDIIKERCNAGKNEITYDVDNKELANQIFNMMKQAGYTVSLIHPDYTFTLKISW